MRLTRIALAAVAAAASLTGVQSANALSAQACADGYYGVVIENNGDYTTVCTNLAYTKSCDRGAGAVVVVGSKHVSACLTK